MVNKKIIKKSKKKQKIAIIGAGISGLSCAYFLSKEFDVTVYEKNNYAGGHAMTIKHNIKKNRKKFAEISFDVGFLVYNDRNYPHFSNLLKILKVETIPSSMSFAVSNSENKYEYGSTGLLSITNNLINLLSINFWIMLFDIIKFYRISKNFLKFKSTQESVGDFITNNKFSDVFIKDHFIPMCGAIWSTSINNVYKMPIIFVLNFFNNHGLLSFFNRPKWRTINSGSRNYVAKVLKHLPNKVLLNEPVNNVKRTAKKIQVLSKNYRKSFDKLILAIHSEDILKVLHKPTNEEIKIFSKAKYENNKIYVHQDIRLMPKNKNVWSAWNVLTDKNFRHQNKKPISLTYWINKLQNIKSFEPILVTLNPAKIIPSKKKILNIIYFKHPLLDFNNLKLKNRINVIQGKRKTYFCGAWLGNGFHEDGIKSALNIVKKIRKF